MVSPSAPETSNRRRSRAVLISKELLDQSVPLQELAVKLELQILTIVDLDSALATVKQHWPRIVLLPTTISPVWLRAIQDEYVIKDKIFKIVLVGDEPMDQSIAEHFIPSHELAKNLLPICLSTFDISPAAIGGAERRRSERFRVYAYVDIIYDGASIEGSAHNISLEGILFSGKISAQNNETLHIRIRPANREPLELEVVVRRTFKNKEDLEFVGAAFKDLDGAGKDYIKNWISEVNGTATLPRAVDREQAATTPFEGEVNTPKIREKSLLLLTFVLITLAAIMNQDWLLSLWSRGNEARELSELLNIPTYSIKDGYFCGIIKESDWASWDQKKKWMIGEVAIPKLSTSKLEGIILTDNVGNGLAKTVPYGTTHMWIINRPTNLENVPLALPQNKNP